MGEQFTKIKNNIQGFWSELSKKNKTLIIGGVLGIIMISLVLAIMLNRVEYTTLYSNLSSKETSEIYAKLQEDGQDVKLEKNEILVPKDKEAELKMKMSIAGYPNTGFNYGYLTDNIDFMTTDAEQQAYIKIMLQENLVTAIKTIQGVRNAYVTVNFANQDDFVLQENKIPASASVLLEPMPGSSLSPMQIKGIEELVAKSVPGLTTENISIVDNTGRYLSYENMEMTDANDNEREKYRLRLDLQRQLDSMLISKVQFPLERVYGKNNIAVSASVTIDYDIKKSESQNYTPSTTDPTTSREEGMIIHEDEKLTTGENSTAEGIPGENENADVPEYPDNQANKDKVTAKEKSADYAVNSLLEQYEKDGYTVTEMSVAVLINKEAMTDDELTSMTNTVAKAAGIDSDNVSVMGIKFAETEANPAIKQMQDVVYASLIGAAGFLLLVIIIVLIISGSKRKKSKKEQKALEEEMLALQLARQQNVAGQFGQVAADAIEKQSENAPKLEPLKPLDVVETKEVQLKKEIKEFTSTNPEIVAQLLRIWLKGEDE
ncbi:MAG: flagellar basal-body MS-ring/collar protein FliF [Oscillospiraceae bacterium]